MATRVLTINDVEIVQGIEIRFKTYDKKDSNIYTGKVLGIVNYDIACSYADIDAKHSNMEHDVAIKQITSQQFILIRTEDNAIRPFAVCWIVDDTSFMRTDISSDATITVFNISQEKLYKLLTYIRDAGFECELRG